MLSRHLFRTSVSVLGLKINYEVTNNKYGEAIILALHAWVVTGRAHLKRHLNESISSRLNVIQHHNLIKPRDGFFKLGLKN